MRPIARELVQRKRAHAEAQRRKAEEHKCFPLFLLCAFAPLREIFLQRISNRTEPQMSSALSIPQNAFNNTRTTRVSPDFALPMNCWKILFVTSMNSSIPASRWRVS